MPVYQEFLRGLTAQGVDPCGPDVQQDSVLTKEVMIIELLGWAYGFVAGIISFVPLTNYIKLLKRYRKFDSFATEHKSFLHKYNRR